MSKPKEPAAAWTATQLEQLLRARHPEPSWAFLCNVADALGRGAARRADCLAMGLWQSVGLKLHGFEVKVSRHDWVRELQDVEKAEAIGRYCDLWWVVAPPAVVKLEELPALWGLLEPVGQALRVRRPATVRPNVDPVSRGFLAALLRKVVGQAPDEVALRQARQEGHRIGYAEGKDHAERIGSGGRAIRDLESLKAQLAVFEQASGVNLADTWNHANIGQAVRTVLAGGQAEAQAAHQLRTARNLLSRALAGIPAPEDLAEPETQTPRST